MTFLSTFTKLFSAKGIELPRSVLNAIAVFLKIDRTTAQTVRHY